MYAYLRNNYSEEMNNTTASFYIPVEVLKYALDESKTAIRAAYAT